MLHFELLILRLVASSDFLDLRDGLALLLDVQVLRVPLSGHLAQILLQVLRLALGCDNRRMGPNGGQGYVQSQV